MKVVDAAAKLIAAQIRDLAVDSCPRDVHRSGRPMGHIGFGQDICKLRQAA